MTVDNGMVVVPDDFCDEDEIGYSKYSRALVEMIRASARSVREEPTRSNSPVSMTRSSFPCWLRGMLAISSRKSVPSCATSNRPGLARTAPVNAPRS